MTSPVRTRLGRTGFARRRRLGADALASALQAQLDTWGFVPVVVAEVFDGGSARVIAAALERFCEEHLGAGIARLELFRASVGSVHGVVLDDRRRVVVKAFRPGTPVARLEAGQTVQRKLWADGFPCPEPLVAPAPLGQGVGTAETMLASGAFANPHLDDIRTAMASALAGLVATCRPFAALEALAGEPRNGLWPRPHDGRFHFEGTSAGAEWIDELAAEADRVQTSAGELVLGHCDWRAENLRFVGDELVAVYDWDSLVAIREPRLVGSVAQNFTSDYGRAQHRQLPTLEEALAFVAAYESARGWPFTAEERRAARAALVYSAAYGARCGHSDRLTDMGRHAPLAAEPWDAPDGTATAFLRDHARELLDA
jgi:hypothetical protein